MGKKDKKDFKPLQGMQEEINLNKIDLNELIEAFKESFEEDITIINISFAVNSLDKDKEDKIEDMISLNHRSANDIKNNRVLVDMNRTRSYENVEKAFIRFERSKNEL